MINDLKKVIFDKEFKVTVFQKKININNYVDILIFEENQILIKTEQCLVKIKGSNLSIIRLLENELLIEGKIKSVEFR